MKPGTTILAWAILIAVPVLRHDADMIAPNIVRHGRMSNCHDGEQVHMTRQDYVHVLTGSHSGYLLETVLTGSHSGYLPEVFFSHCRVAIIVKSGHVLAQ